MGFFIDSNEFVSSFNSLAVDSGSLLKDTLNIFKTLLAKKFTDINVRQSLLEWIRPILEIKVSIRITTRIIEQKENEKKRIIHMAELAQLEKERLRSLKGYYNEVLTKLSAYKTRRDKINALIKNISTQRVKLAQDSVYIKKINLDYWWDVYQRSLLYHSHKLPPENMMMTPQSFQDKLSSLVQEVRLKSTAKRGHETDEKRWQRIAQELDDHFTQRENPAMFIEKYLDQEKNRWFMRDITSQTEPIHCFIDLMPFNRKMVKSDLIPVEKRANLYWQEKPAPAVYQIRFNLDPIKSVLTKSGGVVGYQEYYDRTLTIDPDDNPYLYCDNQYQTRSFTFRDKIYSVALTAELADGSSSIKSSPNFYLTKSRTMFAYNNPDSGSSKRLWRQISRFSLNTRFNEYNDNPFQMLITPQFKSDIGECFNDSKDRLTFTTDTCKAKILRKTERDATNPYNPEYVTRFYQSLVGGDYTILIPAHQSFLEQLVGLKLHFYISVTTAK